MKVAFFASAYHPHVGGVEEVCRQLAAEYRCREIAVAVFTNRWPRNLAELEIVDEIPVHRLPMRVAGEDFKSNVSAALTGRSIRRQIVRLLSDFQPDLLHVHCISSNAVYALAVSEELKLPLVVTLHGELTMDSSQLFQRAEWAKRAMRDSLENADAVTACSRQTLNEAQEWFGKPFGDRGRVIYNGISLADAAVVPYAHPKPYLLAIGRHVRQKGFDLLLRAFAKAKENPQFDHDLILAGDGAEHESLCALVDQLNLKQHVVLTGRVDHAAAMRLFVGCSFFVLPSRHEPFGIVNLEAMIAGKAIVAARVGGVPEIVEDGVNGVLVAPEDVEALSAAVSLLAENESLCDRLGANGKHRVAAFTWPAIAEQYIQVYERICKQQALAV